MTDPRFKEWECGKKCRKVDILEHLDWAHERQSRRDSYRWLSNVSYFEHKYTKDQLVKIHRKYHGE